MLCHLQNLHISESFLERLARAGCDGVLLELHPDTADPRHSIALQKWCQKLNLQFWLMPVIDNPPEKWSGWILNIKTGVPQPAPHQNTFDVLNAKAAQYLFDQIKRYTTDAPDGIFFDSPFANSHQPFPWTADFEKYFSQQHGYQFLDRRHSLISTTGADDALVRQHYWETVNMLREQFLARCHECCAEIKSTFRHNVMEPELAALPLPPQTIWRRRAAHSIEIIYFEHWPQLLKSTFERFINGAFHVAVALPEDVDEEPAAQFFQIAKHACDSLQRGKSAARVGLLFPLRSARTHYHPDSHRYPRWVGEDFAQMTEYLHSMHYNYCLVEETQLQNPPCELLVIPSITAIATESWSAIEAWIKRGGKVACAGLLPRWSERGRDAELEDRISRATKQTLQDVYDGYLAWEQGTALPPHIGYPIFGEDISGGRLCSYTPRLNHDAEDARLRLSQIFRESLQSDFSSQNEEVIYRHFQNGEIEQFALYNNSSQTQQFICRCIPSREAAPGKIEQLNFISSEMQPVPVWSIFPEAEGGGISLSLTFAPHELRIYQMDFKEKQWHLWRSNFEIEKITKSAINGFAQENLRPFCVQEIDGKNVQWVAPKVLLPEPVWIDQDEWHAGESTFTGDFWVPAEWRDHRIMLEMRPGDAAVTLNVNAQNRTTLIAPPFIFDISAAALPGATNHFELRIWQDEFISPPPARLVAWPKIYFSIDQKDNP
jgi:hypothetical protein